MPQAAIIGTTAHSEHIHPEKLCPFCILGPLLLHQPHIVNGPVTSGSNNVLTNSLPAARLQDVGIAVPCCNTNVFAIVQGSPTVLINGRPAARIGDATQHCALYPGVLYGGGSPNVVIGSRTQVPGMPAGAASSPTSADPSASPPTTEDAAPAPAPQELKPLDWKLVYADGQPVRGFISRLRPPAGAPPQELLPDGQGHHQQGQYAGGASYTVTFVGQLAARGSVQTSTGSPASGVRLRVERAFGPPSELQTDGSGRFEVKGLVKEEPYQVKVVDAGALAKGRVVDEKGTPQPGLQLVLQLDGGRNELVTTDAAGRFQIAGLMRTEGYSLTVVGTSEGPE